MLYTKVHEYFETTSETELKEKLLALLESKNWDIRRSAKQLGVSPITLWRVIRERPALARARIKARAEQALKKVS